FCNTIAISLARTRACARIIMPKPLIRLVALFLIPCLVADPSLAALTTSHFVSTSPHNLTDRFDEEALSGRVAGAVLMGHSDNALSHGRVHDMLRRRGGLDFINQEFSSLAWRLKGALPAWATDPLVQPLLLACAFSLLFIPHSSHDPVLFGMALSTHGPFKQG